MSGLVIFLSILLGLFVVVAIVLIVLIINVSRKIARVQKNTASIQKRVSEIINFATMASSAAATAGAVVGKLKVIKDKVQRKKRGKTT